MTLNLTLTDPHDTYETFRPQLGLEPGKLEGQPTHWLLAPLMSIRYWGCTTSGLNSFDSRLNDVSGGQLVFEIWRPPGGHFVFTLHHLTSTVNQPLIRYFLPEKEGIENAGSTVFFHEDPIGGARIENQKELRAPTAHHAAFYLDAAIAARTVPGKSKYQVDF